MNIGLYQSVASMRALLEQQEVLAGNLGRQTVSGHRASVATFSVLPPRPNGTGEAGSPASGAIQPTAFEVVVRPDFSQGMVLRDENPLHLAVQGDAFFSMRGVDGERYYTRNGNFNRARDGRIVNGQGDALLNEGGQPIVLQRLEGLKISADGEISLEGDEIGRIGFGRFEKPSDQLQETRPGVFTALQPDAVETGLGADSQVQQGALEQSNVQSLTQMVNMMSAMRTYEANQKAISIHDEASGRLIRAVSAVA